MATVLEYRIEFAPTATRQFKKLSRDLQVRIGSKIDSLATTPRPSAVRKLEGKHSLYRIRVGNYRVNYEIQDKILLVLVLAVGQRADIYR